GVNHHQLGAVAPCLLDEGPQVHVVAVNIRSPGDNVLRFGELLRLGAQLLSQNGNEGVAAGGGADGAVQLRGAQAMKEAPVHGSVIQLAQRAAVGVGKDRLGAEVIRDVLQL